jgi:hypothetical protein
VIAVVLIVLLTSELPDPGRFSFMTNCAGLGMFVGGIVGWVRRRPLAPFVTGGSMIGFGVGLGCWIVAVAIDRL